MCHELPSWPPPRAAVWLVLATVITAFVTLAIVGSLLKALTNWLYLQMSAFEFDSTSSSAR